MVGRLFTYSWCYYHAQHTSFHPHYAFCMYACIYEVFTFLFWIDRWKIGSSLSFSTVYGSSNNWVSDNNEFVQSSSLILLALARSKMSCPCQESLMEANQFIFHCMRTASVQLASILILIMSSVVNSLIKFNSELALRTIGVTLRSKPCGKEMKGSTERTCTSCWMNITLIGWWIKGGPMHGKSI